MALDRRNPTSSEIDQLIREFKKARETSLLQVIKHFLNPQTMDMKRDEKDVKSVDPRVVDLSSSSSSSSSAWPYSRGQTFSMMVTRLLREPGEPHDDELNQFVNSLANRFNFAAHTLTDEERIVLAACYLGGLGVTRSSGAAFKLLHLAENSSYGKAFLGYLYAWQQVDGKYHYDAAFSYSTIAILKDKEIGLAYCNLGTLFERGHFVAQDIQTAKENYERGIALKCMMSSRFLGDIYYAETLQIDNVKTLDLSKAFECYAGAIKQGSEIALRNYAYVLIRLMRYEDACRLFLIAMTSVHSKDAVWLGVMHDNHSDYCIENNKRKAVEFYRLAMLLATSEERYEKAKITIQRVNEKNTEDDIEYHYLMAMLWKDVTVMPLVKKLLLKNPVVFINTWTKDVVEPIHPALKNQAILLAKQLFPVDDVKSEKIPGTAAMRAHLALHCIHTGETELGKKYLDALQGEKLSAAEAELVEKAKLAYAAIFQLIAPPGGVATENTNVPSASEPKVSVLLAKLGVTGEKTKDHKHDSKKNDGIDEKVSGKSVANTAVTFH